MKRLQNSYMARQSQTDTRIPKAQGIANPMGKRLYTLKEAALYLGRSEWGMRDLIWKQIIPVVKLDGGRKIYLDIADLELFVTNNKKIYV